MLKSFFRFALAFIFIWNNINLLATNNYNLKRIDFDIPIADNSISSMLLDDENSVWFFNSKGLYKYNGSQLLQINNLAQNGSILNGVTIYSISYIRNSVYVCTNEGVYNVNAANLVTKLTLPYTKQAISYIVCNTKNHLILLTLNGQLIDLDPNGISKFIHLPNIYNGKLILIHDTVYVSGNLKEHKSNSSIFKISPSFKLLKEYNIENGFILKSIMVFKNSLIFLNSNFIYTYNAKRDSFIEFDKKFKQIHLLCESKTMKEIVVFEYPNKINIGKDISTLQSTVSFNKRTIVYDVIENPLNGSYFIGTNAGMYLLYKNKLKFEIIEQEFPEFKSNLLVRRQVLEDSQNLYFLYYCGILKRNKSNHQISVLYNNQLNAYSAFMDKHYMWIGADGGSFFGKLAYNNQENKSFFKIKFPKSNSEIVSILNLKNNDLLLGCSYYNKLLIYNTKLGTNSQVAIKEIKKFSNSLTLRKLLYDSNGNVLVASNHGLIVLDKQFNTISQITYLGSNKNVNYEIHDVYIAFNKNIFLATDDGLVEINSKDYSFVRIIDINNLLNNRKCIFVTQDNFNRFWIATYKGLFCYDDQLNISENYTSSDGLPDDEYNFNACKRLENGNIIFGGLNAYIMINPADVKINKSKNILHFSGIYLITNQSNKEFYGNNITTSFSNPFVINKGKEMLMLKFSLSDYLNPKECNYWYKINNQSGWTNIGNTGMLQLWDLPKGENNILIKGKNSMGTPTSNLLTFKVFVAIPFYEETWFISLFIILVLLMISLFFYVRISSYNKLRVIKKELLYDIHDELGGILTKTSMRVELISLKRSVSDEDLHFIVFNVKEALQAVRNVLWSLDSESSNIDNLLDRTRANLDFIFKGSAFDYLIKHKIESDSFNIPIDTKRNILLIIKEAATNTLKHSNGNKFIVTITKISKKYLLQISDNGNCSHLELNSDGYGLKSLEKRVETIKGKLHLNHNETGFLIEVIF
jgi:hypothetical protein